MLPPTGPEVTGLIRGGGGGEGEEVLLQLRRDLGLQFSLAHVVHSAAQQLGESGQVSVQNLLYFAPGGQDICVSTCSVKQATVSSPFSLPLASRACPEPASAGVMIKHDKTNRPDAVPWPGVGYDQHPLIKARKEATLHLPWQWREGRGQEAWAGGADIQLPPGTVWVSRSALPDWGYMGRCCPLPTPLHPQERPQNKLEHW